MTEQQVSSYPIPSNLLAAAAVVKGILECAGAETSHGASQHEEEQHCGQQQQNKQQEQQKQLQEQQQGQQQQKQLQEQQHEQQHQHQLQEQQMHLQQSHQHHRQYQEALPPEILPSRRANRPSRKRQKNSSRFSYRYFEDNPGESGLLQLAAAGLDEEEEEGERKGEANNQYLPPSFGSSDLERPSVDREGSHRLPRSQQQNGPASPDCLVHKSTGDPFAPHSSSSSSLLPPSFACGQDCRGKPFSAAPPPRQPSSTTRFISSETYLRRLFVTASLAHVLSLDECLPRSIVPRKRASSVRVVGRGEDERQHDRGTWQGRKSSKEGDVDDRGSDGTSSDENPVDHSAGGAKSPPSSACDGGFFKKYYPVTLIDAAGQRWSVTYVTNRRDNLHSGRLIDGWETFCLANELRIGDVVEFTKVEEEQEGQRGTRSRKEAVARVTISKRRCCAFRAALRRR